MLERFSETARASVRLAREEAAALGHDRVGTRHLLLGLLHQAQEPVVVLLADLGLDLPAARTTVRRLSAEPGPDAEALASVGIDLAEVVAQVDAVFGPGALDNAVNLGGPTPGRPAFTAEGRRVLSLAVRAAAAERTRRITAAHLLLGVLREGDGLARRVLLDHGVDPAALERAAEACAA